MRQISSTKALPLSRDKIRRVATSIIEKFGLSKSNSVDIVRLFESLSDVLKFNYEIVDDHRLGNNYGTTDLNNNLIKIKESVYLGAVSENPRDRFTIAHELGHFILQKDRIVLCRSNEEIKAYEDPEWQANTFAAELLVPYDRIKELSEEEIIEKYLVSKKVAEIQKSHCK